MAPGPRHLTRLREVASRSISPENFDGSKGGGGRATEGTGAACAAGLGQGWKVSPSVDVDGGATLVLADIHEPGVITHVWLTTHRDNWRTLVLRAYWDGAESPAIEVPLGDAFCNGWGTFAQVSSTMVAANPHGGFNSYWAMPFRSRGRLTLENLVDRPATVYFQVSYETGPDVEREVADAGYLHGQFRRSNPLPYRATHPLVSGIEGSGQYVGTYLAWGVNSAGWWGEGEIKFYLDGDLEDGFPTICGTGTEDYFGGAWNFDVPGAGYTSYSTPYLGMPQVLRPDGLYRSQQRFGLYRWHVLDPIRFHEDLTVDIQALGWRSGHRYRPLQDDIASTTWFYLDRPTAPRAALPTADALEVVGEPIGPPALMDGLP